MSKNATRNRKIGRPVTDGDAPDVHGAPVVMSPEQIEPVNAWAAAQGLSIRGDPPAHCCGDQAEALVAPFGGVRSPALPIFGATASRPSPRMTSPAFRLSSWQAQLRTFHAVVPVNAGVPSTSSTSSRQLLPRSLDEKHGRVQFPLELYKEIVALRRRLRFRHRTAPF